MTSNKIPSGVTIDIEASPVTSSTSSSDGFFSSNGKTNYMKIGLIVVILLFLGVNIFSYLGDFFQHIKDVTAPVIKQILGNLGYVVTETTKDVTNIAAEGAKLGVDVAAGTVESGIDVIQGQLDMEQGSGQGQSASQQAASQQSTNKQQSGGISSSLSSALADAEYNSEPLPDDATSSTQRASSGKAGYCYIGEDRGFRSCVSVNERDTCMSGDIFPSKEICVNPSLRE